MMSLYSSIRQFGGAHSIQSDCMLRSVCDEIPVAARELPNPRKMPPHLEGFANQVCRPWVLEIPQQRVVAAHGGWARNDALRLSESLYAGSAMTPAQPRRFGAAHRCIKTAVNLQGGANADGTAIQTACHFECLGLWAPD